MKRRLVTEDSKRAFLLQAGIALLIVVVALGALWHRLRSSAVDYRDAHAALVTLRETAREIVILRGAQERVALNQRPTEDVIAQVNLVLLSAGIPTNQLRGVSEVSDAPLTSLSGVGSQSAGQRLNGAEDLRAQIMVLQLQAIQLDALGRFLEIWAQSHQLWTPTRIEMIHHRGSPAARGDRGTPDDEGGRWDVQVWVRAVYVSTPTNDSARHASPGNRSLDVFHTLVAQKESK